MQKNRWNWSQFSEKNRPDSKRKNTWNLGFIQTYMIFTSDMKIGNYQGKELDEIMIYENYQNDILEQNVKSIALYSELSQSF